MMRFVVLAFLALWPLAARAADAPAFEKTHIAIVRENALGRISWPLKVELADNDERRAYGFMNRAKIPPSTGMIFVYDRPQPVRMWMKNTVISLDMLFFDMNGEVVMIKDRAQPGDLTPVGPDEAICAVLEIAGGEAARMGIKPGDRLEDVKPLEPCAQAGIRMLQQ